MSPLKLLAFSVSPAGVGAALLFCAGACVAQAEASGLSDLRISGFGTVGLAYVDAPDGWAYKRDASHASNSSSTRADLDTRLGVQLNYAPSPSFELVAQAVATRRASAARDSDAIEWAFAAWRPNADWTLRGGRVNLDAFLLSDHRGVGFAYPFARPPVDFYAQLPTSLDGADLTRVWNESGTQWRAKVFAGRAFVFAGDTDRLELKPVFGAMASREADGWLVRASVIRYRFATQPDYLPPLLDGLRPLAALPVPDLAAQAADLRARLTLINVSQTYVSLGARYEGNDWLLSSEVTRLTGQPTVDFSAGYVSAGRRFGALTAFATASRVNASEPAVATPAWGVVLAPLIGPVAAQQAQFLAGSAAYVVNISRIGQSTLSLGARWDLNPRLAVKAQWDRIRVKANGSGQWGGDRTLDAARANVGSVVVDFVY